MTIKTRLIILGLCVTAFLITVPYIVLYSLGYRIDFANMRLRGTGGIYVYAEPTPSSITVDSLPASTNSYFSSAVFVQNLIPGNHNVVIKKDGYVDYQKTLEVQEKEVTKLENVTLFKKDIAFETMPVVTGQTAKEQFAKLNAVSIIKPAPNIKNALSYKVIDDWILWLGTDGLLYRSDADGQNPKTISTLALVISKKKTYALESFGSHVFLQAGNDAFLLNPKTNELENFFSPVDGLNLSPNGQKIAYWNAHELWYWVTETSAPALARKVLVQKNLSGIKNVYWINNDYLIFSDGDSIIISEIDVRGNTNTITLPQKANQIFFSQQDKKLYILTGKDVMVSERLVP